MDDDVNDSIADLHHIPQESLTDSERAEMCLYFVSVSRHRHVLINAKHLNLENFDI